MSDIACQQDYSQFIMSRHSANQIKPIFMDAPGDRILAMGNQAIARGAIEAGVQLATGYPGTPSTEIMETLIGASAIFGFQAFLGVNEKVAFDAATGASFAGARSLVAVKHVGVNVLSDSLMQINHIDIEGGLVYGTEPGYLRFSYSATSEDVAAAIDALRTGL